MSYCFIQSEHGFRKHFGTVLKKRRRELSMSRVTLGDLIQCSESSISNWENFTSVPIMYTFYKLCVELEINPSEFFPKD